MRWPYRRPGTIRFVSELSSPIEAVPRSRNPDAADAFVRLHARLAPVAFVPEVQLHQADDAIGLSEVPHHEISTDKPPGLSE